MKKQILLFSLLIVSVFALAQVKPSFGLRGGVTSSSMQGDAVNSLKDMLDFTDGRVTTGNRTGFFGGGFVSIPLSEKVSIEPGVYYSQKGYEMRGELNVKGMEFIGANAKAQLTSSYIDVPLLVKANLNGFQLFAGPIISDGRVDNQ